MTVQINQPPDTQKTPTAATLKRIAPPPPPGAHWSPAQIATRTGAHIVTVYRWLREGKLKALHCGRLVRVTEQELKRFEERASV